jgi:hypothetical protein
MRASSSLRSWIRLKSDSGISRPIASTVTHAATKTIAAAPASTIRMSSAPDRDGGLRKSRTSPATKALIAAAFSGGPRISRMVRG